MVDSLDLRVGIPHGCDETVPHQDVAGALGRDDPEGARRQAGVGGGRADAVGDEPRPLVSGEGGHAADAEERHAVDDDRGGGDGGRVGGDGGRVSGEGARRGGERREQEQEQPKPPGCQGDRAWVEQWNPAIGQPLLGRGVDHGTDDRGAPVSLASVQDWAGRLAAVDRPAPGGQRAFQFGLRFSAKARGPSTVSSERRIRSASVKPSLSAMSSG